MSAVRYSILFLLGIPLLGAQAEKTPSPETPKQEEVQKQTESPSLLELAKQERERRASVSEAVSVIRNEDLPGLKRARVATSQSGRPKAGVVANETAEDLTEPAGDADETAASDDLDLDYWRVAFDEARLGLDHVINRRMVLELRMNNLRNAYLQTPDGTTRERIESELNQTFLEVGQAREDEKAAMQVLQELERQAIRAGLNPGQVRDLVGQLPESKSVFDGIPQSNVTPES